MAAPTFVAASTGVTDAGGAWDVSSDITGAAGDVWIVHRLQDGSTAGAVSGYTGSNIENLEGTDNTWTPLVSNQPVGSPTVAYQSLFIGRGINTSAPRITGSNSTSEDLYFRFYRFQNVSTGTTLATVIENGTAGSTANTAATDGTITDAGVTTLGPDRLALQFIGISDDNALASMTGETGGDWTEAVAEYAESSGTDATIGLQTATISTAGTINGGTTTNSDSADGWGVVGFALIGTSVAYDQTHFRFRNDNGDETTATWKESLDTATTLVSHSSVRLRFALVEDNLGNPDATITAQLMYQVNAGGYFAVGDAGSGSWSVRVAASPNVADDTSTTQQISSGTYFAGRFEEGTAVTAASATPVSGGVTEFEWCIEDNSLAVGDVVDLRVRVNSGAGTVVYTQIATFTVVTSAATIPRNPGIHFNDPALV